MGLISGVCRTGSTLAQRAASAGPRWMRAIEPVRHTPISPFEDMGDENGLAWVRARLTCSVWVGEIVARNGSRPGHPSQSKRMGEDNKNR
jgi:hypothetical protein